MTPPNYCPPADRLPRSWELAPLAEIATINPPGGTFSAEDDELVSFVPMPAVRELCGQMDTSDARPYFEVKKGYTRFVEGDVLFAKITPCMENGKIAVARGLINGKGCGSTEFHVLRAGVGILPDWLRYFIVQDAFRGEAQRHMSGAVGQLRVPTDFLRQAHIPLPTTAEQTRVISKIEELFSDLDKGEENLRRAQAQLKRYRQSVLKAAVTGELTRAWREQSADRLESGEALLKRILKARRAAWEQAVLEKLRAKGKPPKDDTWKSRYVEPQGPNTEGLPELPQGWAWASLEQLTSLVTSGSRGWAEYYAETGAVFIRAQDIKTDHLEISSIAYVKLPDNAEGIRTKVSRLDILVTITGANVTKSALVGRDFDEAYVSQHVALVRPVLPEIASYLYSWIICPTHGRKVLESRAYGAGKPGLGLDDLRELVIAVPPQSEQEQLIGMTSEADVEIEGTIKMLAQQVNQAKRLRQSILKAAFSGKLVPQDPNDEPASELLKRIAAERTAQGTRPAKTAAPRAPRKVRAAAQPSASAPATPFAALPGLAAARKAAGLSQAQLAERAGINQAYVSQMETGKRTITADQAIALALALGIVPSALTQA